MLPGAGNHYKYITRDETGEQAPFMPSLYVDGDRLLDPERELPDDFYSTVNYTDKAIQFIDEKPKDEPFLDLSLILHHIGHIKHLRKE